MASEILQRLEKMGSQAVIISNQRFGIKTTNTVGVKIPELRRIAKEIGIDHPLSLKLWETGLREARIIATLTADPECTDLKLMRGWAESIDSWDVVDSCCCNLFWKTRQVDEMIKASIKVESEMGKRFCFVLMACRAKKDRSIGDEKFKEYLEMILSERSDKRHYVSKAIDWAIRTIAGRNKSLNCMVAECLNTSKYGTKQTSPPLDIHDQPKRRITATKSVQTKRRRGENGSVSQKAK
jgi:3-methyladenine DNA glycosylase AlkD